MGNVHWAIANMIVMLYYLSETYPYVDQEYTQSDGLSSVCNLDLWSVRKVFPLNKIQACPQSGTLIRTLCFRTLAPSTQRRIADLFAHSIFLKTMLD